MPETPPDRGTDPRQGRKGRHGKQRRRWKAVAAGTAITMPPLALAGLRALGVRLPHMRLPSSVWLIGLAVLAALICSYFIYLFIQISLLIAAYRKLRNTEGPDKILWLMQGVAYVWAAPFMILKTGELPKRFFGQRDEQPVTPVIHLHNGDSKYLKDAFRLAFNQMGSAKTDREILQLLIDEQRALIDQQNQPPATPG